MNLYEIDSRITEILSTIDMSTGELDERFTEELEQLGIEKEKKIESILCFIKSKKAFSEDLDEEIKTLTKRKKFEDNRIERLISYIQDFLQGEKFETSKVKVGYRKSTSVQVTEEDALIQWATENNPAIVKTETKQKLILDEIRKLINSGTEVPYATLIEKNNIQIK